MPLSNYLVPTHATAAVEQTAGNSTLIVGSINTLTKGLGCGYGVALAGASAFDAFQASNKIATCLFGIGCLCGTVGAVSNGIAVFNTPLGLPALGVVSGTVGGAFYWLGSKANKIARAADLGRVV